MFVVFEFASGSLIKNNAKITKEKLVKDTGLSRATITRYIKKLKEDNKIERIGSDKSGYWKVIDNFLIGELEN